MPCNHRYLNDLLPDWEINNLFIGTFNPEWGEDDENTVPYFYGRVANNFWCVLPEIFNSHIKFNEISNKEKLQEFLKNNKIGITDIIKSLSNADINNLDHKEMVLTYSDIYLENFEIEDNLKNIFKLINKNKIQGVYFTRSSFSKIPKIKNLWNNVINKCIEKGINNYKALLTPSIYGGSCRQIYIDWKNKINL